MTDRRAGARVTPDQTRWKPRALLRPGQAVRVVNLAAGGALVESSTPLRPGARAELQLFGDPRTTVVGCFHRCRVARLMPLVYEGAIVFETPLLFAAVAGDG